MKRIFLFLLTLAVSTAAFAQTQTLYKFTPVRDIPVTSVKNQASTGTCWCFATVSFLEAELIRQGKGEYDLSEMFVVRGNYRDRIFDNYLRQGRGNINPGSIAHMATKAIGKYGIVPESVYDGISYDSPTHNHGELSTYLKAIAGASVELKNLSPEYNELIESLFDIYLGEVPETFTYEGAAYTPKSFAEKLGFDDMSDYIEDPDGEQLVYTIDSSPKGIVHLNQVDNTLNLTTLDYGVAHVVITGTDAKGLKATVDLKVLVRDPSSLPDIYPTTVTDILNVSDGEEKTLSISISNAAGAELYSNSATCDAFSPAAIDLSGWAPGVYTVRVVSGDKTRRTNIVKL